MAINAPINKPVQPAQYFSPLMNRTCPWNSSQSGWWPLKSFNPLWFLPDKASFLAIKIPVHCWGYIAANPPKTQVKINNTSINLSVSGAAGAINIKNSSEKSPAKLRIM